MIKALVCETTTEEILVGIRLLVDIRHLVHLGLDKLLRTFLLVQLEPYVTDRLDLVVIREGVRDFLLLAEPFHEGVSHDDYTSWSNAFEQGSF